MRTIACAAVLAVLCAGAAQAAIPGLSGPAFTLAARTDQIATGEGNSVLIWGYANGAERAQYPGPTLIVRQGQTVTVTLINNLTVATSIVFPGQEGVSATGGSAGLLANEAAPGGSVTYSFVARNPGTFVYHSGTDAALQIEMGLTGALIVRPSLGDKYAYNSAATQFDREYLYFMTAMDPRIHQEVAFRGIPSLEARAYLADYRVNYFFINGRTFPDTVAAPFLATLPTQPYNCLPLMNVYEKVLLRFVGGGRNPHPLHTHGNSPVIVGRQGRPLEDPAAPGSADLRYAAFTFTPAPGETMDAIFQWTGKKLGWDLYGTDVEHTCNGRPVTNTTPAPGEPEFDPVTKEYCPDHGKPFPVTLPEKQFVVNGIMFGGTPFMGSLGALPPGEGGLNPWGGFPYMWHSHNERELTNYNIFPGGLISMALVLPPGSIPPE